MFDLYKKMMYIIYEVIIMKKTKNKAIKDFMQLKGLDNKDMADFYGMPYASFSNKLNQRDFKLSEIIKLVESQECKLVIIDKSNNPIVFFENENND